MRYTTCLKVCMAAVAFFLLCSFSGDSIAYTRPDTLSESIEYVEKKFMTPEEYVIKKFEDHDIVILGEWHRVKHDLVLVQNLIPLLHARGVYTVAIEFALYEDQPLIDALITAKEYDENLARKINLNAWLSIGLGGYKEYCDIFKAAWKVNARLPAGSRKMRILGINDRLDWSLIKTQADVDNSEIRKKIFLAFSEKNWAQRVRNEVLDKGEKVLCYCGIHHAFSKYRQPYVDEDGTYIRSTNTRFGNYLYESDKDTVFMISLHYPWNSLKGYGSGHVLPVDGAIDYLIASLPVTKQRFGFDTADSPMGLFKAETSLYKYGYKDFRLRDFCDGYICQGTFAEYEAVTPIKDFINADNFEYVQKHLAYPDNTFSADKLNEDNASISYNFKKYHLKDVLEAIKNIQ